MSPEMFSAVRDRTAEKIREETRRYGCLLETIHNAGLLSRQKNPKPRKWTDWFPAMKKAQGEDGVVASLFAAFGVDPPEDFRNGRQIPRDTPR